MIGRGKNNGIDRMETCQENLFSNGEHASLIEWIPSQDKDFVTQVIPPPLYD